MLLLGRNKGCFSAGLHSPKVHPKRRKLTLNSSTLSALLDDGIKVPGEIHSDRGLMDVETDVNPKNKATAPEVIAYHTTTNPKTTLKPPSPVTDPAKTHKAPPRQPTPPKNSAPSLAPPSPSSPKHTSAAAKPALHYKFRLYIGGPFVGSREQEIGIFGNHCDEEGSTVLEDIIWIVMGYESGRTHVFLDTRTCLVKEYVIRMNGDKLCDVKTWIEGIIEEHRSLKVIPYPEKVSILCGETPERDREITIQELEGQVAGWGTDLDEQFLRQVYRGFVWPDAFRREECWDFVRDWTWKAQGEEEESRRADLPGRVIEWY
ncbi:hypothetical protein OQA88_5273 [Cercophora sp. LCS_1]